MSDRLEELIEELLSREGGYVNDPKDSGGETNWGITKAVARANGYTGPMRSMSAGKAKEIYRQQYWAKPGLHRIAAISERVADELLDTGVNMGPGVAARFLQRALNALNRQGSDYPDLAVDGALGPASAAALKAFLSKRGAGGESVLLRAMNCLQGARYVELAEAREASEAFLFGWLQNRIGDIA